jgi:hypothetical protein
VPHAPSAVQLLLLLTSAVLVLLLLTESVVLLLLLLTESVVLLLLLLKITAVLLLLLMTRLEMIFKAIVAGGQSWKVLQPSSLPVPVASCP